MDINKWYCGKYNLRCVDIIFGCWVARRGVDFLDTVLSTVPVEISVVPVKISTVPSILLAIPFVKFQIADFISPIFIVAVFLASERPFKLVGRLAILIFVLMEEVAIISIDLRVPFDVHVHTEITTSVDFIVIARIPVDFRETHFEREVLKSVGFSCFYMSNLFGSVRLLVMFIVELFDHVFEDLWLIHFLII